MSTKTKTDETKSVILRFGKENNFNSWKIFQIAACTREFGFQANVLKNGITYTPRAVVAEDYMPAVEVAVVIEGGVDAPEPLAPLNNAALATLRVEAEKDRNKEVRQLRLNAPKFFNQLWEYMSVESRQEITQHADYLEADLNQNPNMLFRIATETHVTAIHGGGAELRNLETVRLLEKFNTLHQKQGMSIGEFKKLFDEQIIILAGAGVPEREEPELAMVFLTKLDVIRYGAMMSQLTNDASRGIPFPQTLHAAWSIASGWTTSGTKASVTGEMHSVLVLADNMGKQPRGGPGRGGRGGRGGGRGRTGGRSPSTPSDPGNGGKGPGREQQAEPRTCRGCLTKGHIWSNCPDNPDRHQSSSAFVAIGEEDPGDEEAIYNACFMMNETVFFSPTEVLLDNQASKSIFKNCNLLSNIRDEDPFFIGGIDGTSRGLKVSESGDFGGLGRVGLSRSAAANVLSKTQMLDGGKRVSYDQDEGVYRHDTTVAHHVRSLLC